MHNVIIDEGLCPSHKCENSTNAHINEKGVVTNFMVVYTFNICVKILQLHGSVQMYYFHCYMEGTV